MLRIHLLRFYLLIISLAAAGCIANRESQNFDRNAAVSAEELASQAMTDTLSMENPDIVVQQNITPGPTINPHSDAQGEVSGGDGQGETQTDRGETLSTDELNTQLWLTYDDIGNGYQIMYPSGFISRELTVSETAKLQPVPFRVIQFMDKALADSQVADIAPPDLSIRIWQNPQEKLLQTWLEEMGLATETSIEPYQGLYETGLKLCQATLAAPNCTIYFAAGSHVFGLTPLGLFGEEMVETFVIDR